MGEVSGLGDIENNALSDHLKSSLLYTTKNAEINRMSKKAIWLAVAHCSKFWLRHGVKLHSSRSCRLVKNN